MNITRSNWGKAAPILMEKLRQAEFVSIDFEMSGIMVSPLLRPSTLDSTQARYWKIKESVRRLLPLQIGLCGFRKVGEKYMASPFNVYLFPYTGHEVVEQQFMFQSGAIHFLAEHGYDFNRSFYDGVFYLSQQNEKILDENKIIEEIKKEIQFLNTTADPDMKAFVNLHFKQIKRFFRDPAETELQIPIRFVKVRNYTYLLQHVEKLNQPYHVVYDQEQPFKRSTMTIKKGSVENKEKEEEVVIDPIGIRKAVDLIIERKIPIVFHNGMQDLCHLYDKFVCSLPETQQEFKHDIRNTFPTIYDTKYIVNTSGLISNIINAPLSKLDVVFKALERFKDHTPLIELEEGFDEYNIHSKQEDDEIKTYEHEAGYDALMTGYNFLKITKLIQQGQLEKDAQFDINYERLLFYKNRLPSGSVRLPFNLEDETDRFHGQHTRIFYVSIVQRSLIPMSSIQNYFREHFGDVTLYTSYAENFEYFMIFKNNEGADKFQAALKEDATVSNIALQIVQVEDRYIVVSTYESFKDRMKRRAKDEIALRQMPNCLD